MNAEGFQKVVEKRQQTQYCIWSTARKCVSHYGQGTYIGSHFPAILGQRRETLSVDGTVYTYSDQILTKC